MLQVGFARLDITPPLGDDLAGYFHARHADGVRDPLYLNALAVGDEQQTLLILTLDCMAIAIGRCDRMRRMISEQTGVPTDRIAIAALHQHTAPYPLEDEREDRLQSLRDPSFNNVLDRKVVDGARMAIDDMREATLRVGSRELEEPIAFVRRYYTDDGAVKSNPNTEKYHIVKRCAEADNTVRLVRFCREGAKDIALVNFSTHPDVVSGSKWSADWPGFTRTFVETELKDVSCIFLTGCQGDSNHIDYFKPKHERIRGGKGYEHSQYMGHAVADAVIREWDKTTPVEGEGISSQYRLLYTKTNTEGIEYYDEAVAWDAEYRRREEEEGVRKNIPHPYIQSIAHVKHILGLRMAPIFSAVPLTVMRVGGVSLVGFGGEAFTSYGEIVRRLCPDQFVICSVCTNGYAGYFPTAEAFAQGGYEVITSPFTPDVEQELADTLKDMVSHM